MQAGVAAVIIAVVIEMGHGILVEKNRVSVLIMAAAFILTFFLNINVVYVVIGCIVFGAVRTWSAMKKLSLIHISTGNIQAGTIW